MSGFDLQVEGLSVRTLHVLKKPEWASSGCAGFLLQSREIRISSTCCSKSLIGVSVKLQRVDEAPASHRCLVAMLVVSSTRDLKKLKIKHCF